MALSSAAMIASSAAAERVMRSASSSPSSRAAGRDVWSATTAIISATAGTNFSAAQSRNDERKPCATAPYRDDRSQPRVHTGSAERLPPDGTAS